MNSLSIITAFLFGFLAFFSACTFPLVPSFVSFLVGVSFNELKDPVYTAAHRKNILLYVAAYILGSCFILVLLGATAGSFGYFLRSERYIIQQIGGIVVIVFGLYLLDVIKIPFLWRTFELRSIINKVFFVRGHNSSVWIFVSFLLGIVFTLGWIPCLSPILGSILVLASSTSSTLYGSFLLFMYAVGQNLPLLLIAVFFSSFLGYFTWLAKHIRIFNRLSAILMILLGILLLLGSFSSVTQFFYQIVGLRLFPF